MRIKKGYLLRGSPVYLRSCWSVVAPLRCHLFCKCNHSPSKLCGVVIIAHYNLYQIVCSPRGALHAYSCTTCKVSCIRCKVSQLVQIPDRRKV